MTIFCFGSINIDHVYGLPRLPERGETLAAAAYSLGLGGKGANQSVAAARAGAQVVHLGAVGADGAGICARLSAMGVDCSAVQHRDDLATGHAVILLGADGENSIILYAGANRAHDAAALLKELDRAELGDILLMQNETALQAEIAEHAVGRGLEVIYSAAPFELDAVCSVLPFVNILVMNAIEAEQLCAALDTTFEDLPVESVVVTRGSNGAEWIARGAETIAIAAFPVEAVDTTGAGDCFAGVLAARLDAGDDPARAMRFASAAAALQVTRPGAAEAMPHIDEVTAFLDGHPRG